VAHDHSRVFAAVLGAALLVALLYESWIVPRVLEWADSRQDAQRAAFDRFSLAPGASDRDIEVLATVIGHQEGCYPTKLEWIWSRLDVSFEDLTKRSRTTFCDVLTRPNGPPGRLRQSGRHSVKAKSEARRRMRCTRRGTASMEPRF